MINFVLSNFFPIFKIIKMKSRPVTQAKEFITTIKLE